MNWRKWSGSVIAVALLCLAPPAAAQTLNASASQSPSTVRPGQPDVTYFTLTITSSNLIQVQLTSLVLTDTTSGTGTRAQMDAELGTVRLYRDIGAATYEPGVDVFVAQAVASGGKVRFTPISVNVPALGSVRLHAVANVPLGVRDGDRIDLMVLSASDMTFNLGGPAGGAPLHPSGDFPVDGMI